MSEQLLAAPAVEPAGVKSGFRHLHAAHCESGVTASLLRNRGFEISEPMVFGVGSGVFFLHAPFFKVMGIPLTTYRTYPLSIFRKACKRLGVEYRSRRFLTRERGVRELDALIGQGIPVGLQANMFWLSYFPLEFRFQFNGHNLIVVRRDGADYEVSDPVLEAPVRCPADALVRARFARGPLSPRGLIYYPVSVPQGPGGILGRGIGGTIRSAIADSCGKMLRTPAPFVGVQGIRYLARRMRSWPARMRDERTVRLNLANIVRMQEEVGTGGGGFRFMYAAFLQEAGTLLRHEPLLRASEMMTAAGDLWRRFAAAAALICKERHAGKVAVSDLAGMLLTIAEEEERAFRFLRANLPGA